MHLMLSSQVQMSLFWIEFDTFGELSKFESASQLRNTCFYLSYEKL